MTEHNTVLHLTPPAEVSGDYRGAVYQAVTKVNAGDISRLRGRYPRDTSETLNTAPGVKSGWIPGTSWDTTIKVSRRVDIVGDYRGARYTAKTSIVPAMYTERDRTPRIGVHQTVSGYGIKNSNVLITGKLGITTAAKTDGRGIWWAYLPKDDYSNADIKSFTESGKVYKLLEQTERLPADPYIWDEVMSLIDNAGTGYRMIHKRV